MQKGKAAINAAVKGNPFCTWMKQTGYLPKNKQQKSTHKTTNKRVFMGANFGALEEIRTPDLLVRSQALYPTELPAQNASLRQMRHL